MSHVSLWRIFSSRKWVLHWLAPAPQPGWQLEAGDRQGQAASSGRDAHFPPLPPHRRQQRQAVRCPHRCSFAGAASTGAERAAACPPPPAPAGGFPPAGFRCQLKWCHSVRCFHGQTEPGIPVWWTGANFWACHQPKPARELTVADLQGSAAHAKSASQIGLWFSAESQPLWESRSPPLNWVLTPSAWSSKYTKAPLTLGGKLLNTSLKKKKKRVGEGGRGYLFSKIWYHKALITPTTEIFKRLYFKTN